MVRLRDLEEILLSIEDEQSRDYMAEAVRCYHAEAYRASIVTAFGAAMDHLRRRMAELLSSGVGSGDLKNRFKLVENAFEQQKAFERELVDLCEKPGDVLTPSEAKQLRALLETRHLAAHPSGFLPNAETARSCIATLVDLVLARPIQLGITEAKALVERLQLPTFFPDPSTKQATVKTELSRLHQGAYPALVLAIIDRLRELAEARKAAEAGPRRPDSAIRENMIAFLGGMAAQSTEIQKVVARYTKLFVESDLLAEEVIPLLDVEPGLYGALDALTRGRTLATLRNAIGRLSVKRVLTELRKREILTADESTLVSSSFESESMPLGVALALDWPEVHRSRILVVLSEAGSSWRLTSAKAIDTIQNLSDEYAARFTEGERARYVLEVARGASWEASQLVSGGLGARRDFLDDFGRHLNNVPADMLSVRTSWTSVIRMLLASDRPDLVRACLSLWEHPDAGELKLDDEVFAIIEAQGDPELRQAAKDFLKRKKRDDGAGT